MLIYLPRIFNDLLELNEDAHICNVGVFRDLALCDDAKYIIFIVLSFSVRRFWLIRSRINLTYCQDAVI